jgi:hypothetical protein
MRPQSRSREVTSRSWGDKGGFSSSCRSFFCTRTQMEASFQIPCHRRVRCAVLRARDWAERQGRQRWRAQSHLTRARAVHQIQKLLLYIFLLLILTLYFLASQLAARSLTPTDPTLTIEETRQGPAHLTGPAAPRALSDSIRKLYILRRMEHNTTIRITPVACPTASRKPQYLSIDNEFIDGERSIPLPAILSHEAG